MNRVIIWQDNQKIWLARWLEHDIVAQGQSIREAVTMFEVTVRAYMDWHKPRGTEPFAGIPPASQEYFDMYERGMRLGETLEIRATDDSVVTESAELKIAA